MKKISVIFPLILVLSIIYGCGGLDRAVRGENRWAREVRSGILRVDLPKMAFLDVWGEPTRADTAPTEEVMSASWGAMGGNFFKGSKTVEIWTYENIGIKLVFDRNRLVAWKTDKTVQELKAAAKPKQQ